MEAGLAGYMDGTQATGLLIAQHYGDCAASGGTIVAQAGFDCPVAANVAAAPNMSNGAVGNVKYTTSPILFPFYRLKTYNSGDTGAVTSGTLFLYGIK
jgi:hypothetical protein